MGSSSVGLFSDQICGEQTVICRGTDDAAPMAAIGGKADVRRKTYEGRRSAMGVNRAAAEHIRDILFSSLEGRTVTELQCNPHLLR